MKGATARRRIVALVIAAVLGLGGVAVAAGNSASVSASDTYAGQRQAFEADVQTALSNGFTEADLQPAIDRLVGIEGTPAPFWLGSRPAYFTTQARSMTSLRRQLQDLLASVVDGARTGARQALAADRDKISYVRGLGADEVDLAPLRARADQLSRQVDEARSLTEYRSLTDRAIALGDDADAVAAAQAAENTALTQLAAQLQAQYGSLDAIRKAARDRLGNGRDEATFATFLDRKGNFRSAALLARALAKMERAATGLDNSDSAAAVTAAAGVIRYASQLHDVTAAGLPTKAILVSINDQHLWAYEGGKVVMDTIVTTGRPALATDIGPMKVLYRQAPFKMISPWPKSSPFYYPPSDVRKVIWFSDTGEGLHDAPWRSWFGPGSNIGDGTHGCINLPGTTVDFLFDWAPNGTPVIVIPGTGETLDAQLAQDTIDTPAGATIKGI